MPGKINAYLAHSFYGFGSNTDRINARALHFKAVASHRAQQAFRHLTARRVSCAENQHALFLVHSRPSFMSCGITIASASFASCGMSQRKSAVAAAAPNSCATMKPGTSEGRIPAKVSLIERARVTAGLANEVDAVNQ